MKNAKKTAFFYEKCKKTSLEQNPKFFPKSFTKASQKEFEILQTLTKNDPRWMGALIS